MRVLCAVTELIDRMSGDRGGTWDRLSSAHRTSVKVKEYYGTSRSPAGGKKHYQNLANLPTYEWVGKIHTIFPPDQKRGVDAKN